MIYLHATHTLSRIDRLTDCALGLIHIDNKTIFNTARTLVTQANNAGAMRTPISRRDFS
jgi:hypothetical protein